MMPVRLIGSLAATLDDRRCSPIADTVAGVWDLPVGSARWWRSSACHVFAVPPVGYLRFVPDSVRSASSFVAIAALMAGDVLPDRQARLRQHIDRLLSIAHDPPP